MAQNLIERLKAAMSPRARVTDTATLLTDLKAEQARLEVAREQAAAESVDFVLSEADREQAAAKAGRLDRTIKGLEAEIAKVAALLEERRSDESRRVKEAEKRAAITERDELAVRFAQRVPALTAELIDLSKAVNANAERMRLAGLADANAELIARGIPASGHVQMMPVMRFTEMKIPAWASHGRAWPITQTEPLGDLVPDLHTQYVRARATAERERAAEAEAKAKFAREHGRYEITALPNGNYDCVVRIPRELVIGDIPHAIGPWEKRQPIISHEIAEKLGKVPGLKITRLDVGRK